MSRASNRKKIQRLELHRARVVSELLKVRVMLRGSFAVVHTKCGKPNCWCKDQKGHPHARLTWSEQGRPVTRKVPRNNTSWILKVTEDYRRFRSLRRQLNELEVKIKQLLDEFENTIIKETRKGKNFLTVPATKRKLSGRIAPKKGK